MRPQDIVVLLKIAALGREPWYVKDLAMSVGISQGEVSESLKRSAYAGLLADDKRTLMRGALLDFLSYGFRYVFPQKPGFETRGVPTAHAAAPLQDLIRSEVNYVWPYAKGETRGFSIEALHPGVPEASLKDPRLHALLALADALRVGKSREQEIARQELEKRLNHEQYVT